MKEAIKLYYKYMPKWLMIYRVIRDFIGAGSSVLAGVLVPAAISGYFVDQIAYSTLLGILGLNFLLIMISILPDYYVQAKILPKRELQLTQGIQKSVFGKLYAISVRQYDNQELFEKYRLAMDNTEDAARTAASWLSSITGMLVKIVTTTVIISIIDARIFLLMGGCLILGVVLEVLGVSLNLRFKERNAKIENVLQYCHRVFYLEDYVTELRTSGIKNSIFDLLNNTVNNAIDILKKLYKKLIPLNCIYSMIPEVVMYFGIVGYICYGIVVKQTLSVSELVALLMGTLTLYQTLSVFTASFSKIYECCGRYKYYQNFMAIEEEGAESEKEICTFAKTITLDQVSMEFGEKRVLDQVSMQIRKGEVTAIIGPNGSGKSTILKLIQQFYKPTGGSIYLDDKMIDAYRMDSYRSNFAYVGQFQVIFEMSVAENVLMKHCETEDDREQVWKALEKVGLKEKIASLESDIETIIGEEFSENGVHLSGGQMQRLVIARALVKNCPIILLDEPSSHLDPKTERELFELLRKEGKTVIYITHNIKNAGCADQILWLEKGVLREKGTHEQLMDQKGSYYDAYCSLYNVLLEE